MSSLEANRITGKDIKDSKVSHSVPPIQKPESVKSSEAVALNVANSGHKRSGSLDSSAFPSQSSSPRSIPILHTTASALLANSARLKYLKDGPDSSSDRSRAGQTAKSSSEARVNAQISQSLLQRRASMISPALEAAIESATRDSSRPNYRALSQTTSKTDMQLQRRSTAMQVASAAAMAAMEVSLVKTNQAAGHIDHLECMGRNEQQGDSRLNTRDEETREKVASNAEVTLPRPPALSTNIPDVLLPHPHRQGTLILRESIFAPLDIQDIIGNSSPKPDKAKRVEVNIDLKPPTPIALLPRPHARARTLSMDEGRRPADDFDTAPTRVAESTLLHRTTLSSDTLPSSHPDYYFERTAVVEYLEKYLLSYSYVDSQSTPSTPIKTLPKGAAKPVTIGGARAVNTAGIASQSSRNAALPDSQTQRNPPPASYLLPQGLMDLCWKFSPDNSEMSIVDLILCGLLDPSSESLAVYQNAMTLAAKISNDGENITLDGLMALGALNGEDAGAWHRLPKAWIGGIADIDVQGATPQSFAVPVNNLDRGDDITLVRKDLSDVDLPRNPTAFPTPNLASVSIPRATLSAVDLHAQTVALSSRASSTSPEAPRNRSVSRERVRSQPATPLTPRHPVNEYVHPNTKPDTDKSSVRRASATTTTPDTSPELNTITLLHRIVSPPKLSPLVIPFTKTLHSAVPPGAALPANPHLPSVFSSFPRHSAMFIKPPNLNLPTSPQSTKRPDIMEDDEREKAPYDNESEDASDITSSSDALLSPVAISPSLAGTDAIFNEESDPPNPPSDDIQVTVNVVSLSDSEDDTSVIAESIPPPKNSFLFDHSAPEADAASILTQDSQTPTAPHPANSIIATRNASESTNTEVSCGEIQRRSTLPKDFPSITVGAGAETHVEDMTSLDTKVSKLSRSSTFNGRISTEIEPAGSETPTPTQENMKPSMPNTPASVATLAQNSASSPRLSILSLPLNNLSALPTHPNGPTEPDRASLSSESCLSSPSSYSCSSGSLQSITASPEPLPATSLTPPSPSTVINRRQPYLSLRTSSSLARRHSNGGGLLAPPVGPREPKRSRSLRVAPEETSEVESAPVQVMSPIPRRPLPIPVMEPVADRPNTDTIVSQLPAAGMSGLESEGKSGAGKTSGEPDTRAVREIHEPKDKMRSLSPPLPVLSSSSRPNSRGNTPTPIAPLRKLAIDELPIRSLRRPAKEARTEGPRPATIAVAMANSVEGDRVVENVVAVGSDSAARRSKWKFWASEDKPVSVMVDLTREI
ncbi:hypothetical protein GYMLUDRAFT_729580 [Collybiopsis luxurians FD-317 M1]|nr:hypothetical protein GYMLUDRAFT_729580 [Collybiopsis luxurians FD-317 M1]